MRQQEVFESTTVAFQEHKQFFMQRMCGISANFTYHGVMQWK